MNVRSIALTVAFSEQMCQVASTSEFEEVLGSDFYAGYNIHQGLHQRCWVHFLRDIHDLKEQFPQDEEVLSWAKAVKAIYEQAIAFVQSGPDLNLLPRDQQQLWQVCQPYVRTAAPQHPLCARVERFLPELFVFVAVPEVPPHNNLTERSVRPLVMPAKSVGATVAPKGVRPEWGLPPSLAPGWHNSSIPSTNVWLPSLQNLL